MPTTTSSSPIDFFDLYTDLLNKAREDTSLAATVDQAKRYINEALLEMQLSYHEKLPWLIRDAVLITSDPYSTGTITTMAQGSTAVTGSSTAWSSTNAFGNANARRGGLMKFAGSRDTYRVASVGGATTLTLESAFVGTSLTSGDSYEYFEDQYALASDFLRPVEMSFFDSGHSIQLVGRSEFRQRFPRNNVTGKPVHGTMIDEGAEPSHGSNVPPGRRIRLSRPADAIYNIPYSYITKNTCYAGGATGSFAFTGTPSNNDRLTINGQQVDFVTSLSGSPTDEVVIGVSAIATIDAAVAMLNASTLAALDDITYRRIGMSLHMEWDSKDGAGDAITIVVTTGTVMTASAATLELRVERENMQADWDVPLCPQHLRSAIVDLALYRWHLYKKDDARAQQAKADADTKLSRLVSDSEIGSQRPRLVPSVTRYRRGARKPYSPGSSTKYDINGRFDRLEDR